MTWFGRRFSRASRPAPARPSAGALAGAVFAGLASVGLALVGVALTGCGGAEPAPEAPPPVAQTAGEEVAAPQLPEGPPLSYVGEGDTVVMRVDMERVRGSSLAREISAQVRAYPTWRELLGSSGIDPVQDFDRVLAAAPRSVVDEGVLLVRHHLTEAQVREAVLNMAVERGERPAWREVEGFDVVDWPAPSEPPRIVVITAEGELVVTTPATLESVLEVARDHRLRREVEAAPEALYEPALALQERTIATVDASELTEQTTRRVQHPPEAFEVVLEDDAEEAGRVHLRAAARYPDPAAAEAARAYFAEQRDFYAGQMLVRAVGLDRPLREAEITAEGPTVDVHASLTEEEIERVFGLLAAMQQFQQ